MGKRGDKGVRPGVPQSLLFAEKVQSTFEVTPRNTHRDARSTLRVPNKLVALHQVVALERAVRAEYPENAGCTLCLRYHKTSRCPVQDAGQRCLFAHPPDYVRLSADLGLPRCSICTGPLPCNAHFPILGTVLDAADVRVVEFPAAPETALTSAIGTPTPLPAGASLEATMRAFKKEQELRMMTPEARAKREEEHHEHELRIEAALVADVARLACGVGEIVAWRQQAIASEDVRFIEAAKMTYAIVAEVKEHSCTLWVSHDRSKTLGVKMVKHTDVGKLHGLRACVHGTGERTYRGTLMLDSFDFLRALYEAESATMVGSVSQRNLGIARCFMRLAQASQNAARLDPTQVEEQEHAVKLAHMSLEINTRVLGRLHTRTAVAQVEVGVLLQQQIALAALAAGIEGGGARDTTEKLIASAGRVEKLFVEALSVLKQTVGNEHPEFVRANRAMANLCIQLSDSIIKAEGHTAGHDAVRRAGGHLTQAIPYLQHNLEVAERVNGVSGLETGTALSELAGVYLQQGRHNTALPLLERAHTILCTHLAPRSLALASTKVVYAKALLAKTPPATDTAVALLEHALEVEREQLSSSNRRTAATRQSLIVAYTMMQMHEKCLRLVNRLPNTAFSCVTLEIVSAKCAKLAWMDRAEHFIRRAVSMREQIVTKAYDAISWQQQTLMRMGDKVEGLAISKYRQRQVEALHSRQLLANVIAQQGRQEVALAMRAATAAAKKKPTTAKRKSAGAKAAAAKAEAEAAAAAGPSKTTQAVRVLKKVLAAQVELQDVANIPAREILNTLQQLMDIYTAQPYETKMLHRGKELLLTFAPKSNVASANSFIELAKCFRYAKEPFQAELMYKEALTIQRPLLGATHRDVKSTERSLNHAYRQQGKFWMITPDEAMGDKAALPSAAQKALADDDAAAAEDGPGRRTTTAPLRPPGSRRQRKRRPMKQRALTYTPMEREKYVQHNLKAKEMRIRYELGSQLRQRRIDERNANRRNWGACVVQCRWRCFVAQRELFRRRRILYSIHIQAVLRGSSVRRRNRREREAAEAEARRLREIAAATKMQAARRQQVAKTELHRRQHAKVHASENRAALVLQRRARVKLATRGLDTRKRAVVTLQCACRRRLHARSVNARKEEKAATLLNGICRRRLAKAEMARRLDKRYNAAVMMQKAYRRRMARATLMGKRQESGARKLQRAFRAKKRRKKPRVWKAIGSALLASWQIDAEEEAAISVKTTTLTPEGEFDYSSDPMMRLQNAHAAFVRAMGYMEEDDPSTFADLSRLYLGFGAFDGCAQTCAKIIAESPTYEGIPNVVFIAAVALMHLQMYDEAAAYFQHLLEASEPPKRSKDPPASLPTMLVPAGKMARPLLTLLLGRVLERGNEMRLASKAYKRCFATIYTECGGYDAVYEYESWRTWFADPRPWLTLGKICNSLSLSFTAAEMINEAVERNLAEPDLWIELARAQSKCGETQLEDAIHSAERAVALDPRVEEYARAVEQLRGRLAMQQQQQREQQQQQQPVQQQQPYQQQYSAQQQQYSTQQQPPPRQQYHQAQQPQQW